MGLSVAQPARPMMAQMRADARAVVFADAFVLARYIRAADAGGLAGVPGGLSSAAPVVKVQIVLGRPVNVQSAARAAAAGSRVPAAVDHARGAATLAVCAAGPEDAAGPGGAYGTPETIGGVSVHPAIGRLNPRDVFVVPGVEVGRPEVEDVEVKIARILGFDGVVYKAEITL